MRGTSTPRKWRPLGLAFSVVAALALPACAFWELDDWDDHAGENPDGGDDAGSDAKHHDAGPDAKAEAGPLTFCDRKRAEHDRVLFCQDFDEADAAPINLTKCTRCQIDIEPADGAPSSPNVLVLRSQTGDSKSSVYESPTIPPSDAKYTSVSGEFWALVDAVDVDNQPAFQEVGYLVDSDNCIRFRITVFKGKFWSDIAITSKGVNRFVEPDHVDADIGVWHHFQYNVATNQDGERVYSWTIDGVPRMQNYVLTDAGEIHGDTTEIDLTTGFYYPVEPTSAGDSGIRMDSVLLTTP